MKTAIIIGGSFNPITKAHLYLGHKCKELFPEADIIYIPTNMTYISHWKHQSLNKMFSNENRNKTLKNVFKNSPFILSEVESSGQLSGKTFETVEYFKKEYDEIYVVIGSDKLTEIEKWYRFTELIEDIRFILFSRNNQSFNELASDNLKQFQDRFIIVTNNELQTVSSTMIRSAYENNKLDEIKEYIPIEVYDFLNKGE